MAPSITHTTLKAYSMCDECRDLYLQLNVQSNSHNLFLATNHNAVHQKIFNFNLIFIADET